MISKKFLAVPVLALAAASANATITLTGSGSLLLGGVFAGQDGLQPTYTANSSVSSIVLNSVGSGVGTMSLWYFSDVDSSPITTVTYQITVSGIGPSTEVAGLIQAFSFDPATGNVGPTNYLTTPIFYNVDALDSSNANTQTLTFVENLQGAGFNVNNAYFEGNIQFLNAVPEPTGIAAVAVGALGLLIRRRRTK